MNFFVTLGLILLVNTSYAVELSDVIDSNASEFNGNEKEEYFKTYKQRKNFCEGTTRISKYQIENIKKSKEFGKEFQDFYKIKTENHQNCPEDEQIVAEFFAQRFGISRFSGQNKSNDFKKFQKGKDEGNSESFELQAIIDQALKDEFVYVIADNNLAELNQNEKNLPEIRAILENYKKDPEKADSKANVMIDKAQKSLMNVMNLVLQKSIYETNQSIKKLHKNIPLSFSQKDEKYRKNIADFNNAIELSLSQAPFLAIQGGAAATNTLALEMKETISSSIKKQLNKRPKGSTSLIKKELTQDEVNEVAMDLFSSWFDLDSKSFKDTKVVNKLLDGVNYAIKKNRDEINRLQEIKQQIVNGVVSDTKQNYYNEVASKSPQDIQKILIGSKDLSSNEYGFLLRAYCLLDVAESMDMADKSLNMFLTGSLTAAFGPAMHGLIALSATAGVARAASVARVVRLSGLAFSAHGLYNSYHHYNDAFNSCNIIKDEFDKKMIKESLKESDDEKLMFYAQENITLYNECVEQAANQMTMATLTAGASLTSGVSSLRSSDKILGSSLISKVSYGMNLSSSGIESGVAIKNMMTICSKLGWDKSQCTEAKLALGSSVATLVNITVGNKGPSVTRAFNSLKASLTNGKVLEAAATSGLLHESINLFGGRNGKPLVAIDKMSKYVADRKKALEDFEKTEYASASSKKAFLENYDDVYESAVLGDEFTLAKQKLLSDKSFKGQNLEEAAITLAITRAKSSDMSESEALAMGRSMANTLVELKKEGDLSKTKLLLQATKSISNESEVLISETLKRIDPKAWSIVKENFNEDAAEAIQLYFYLKTNRKLKSSEIHGLLQEIASECKLSASIGECRFNS